MKVGLWPLKGTLLSAMMGFFNCSVVIRAKKKGQYEYGALTRHHAKLIFSCMAATEVDLSPILTSQESGYGVNILFCGVIVKGLFLIQPKYIAG